MTIYISFRNPKEEEEVRKLNAKSKQLKTLVDLVVLFYLNYHCETNTNYLY